jgi:hypothetical protein
VPTPVGSALSKARQCTPRMVASFFCCSWTQCEFVHGLMPPSLKHLIGFRRDRREAVFLSGVNKKCWFNFKLRAH